MDLAKFQPSPWTQAEWENKITAACNSVVQECRPLAVFVFGSALESAHRTAGSDIDLCVVVDSDESRRSLAPFFNSLKQNAQIPLDLVVFTRVEFAKGVDRGALAEVVLRTGKILFGSWP